MRGVARVTTRSERPPPGSSFSSHCLLWVSPSAPPSDPPPVTPPPSIWLTWTLLTAARNYNPFWSFFYLLQGSNQYRMKSAAIEMFSSHMSQVGGFLRVLRFPPPVKLTSHHYHNGRLGMTGCRWRFSPTKTKPIYLSLNPGAKASCVNIFSDN